MIFVLTVALIPHTGDVVDAHRLYIVRHVPLLVCGLAPEPVNPLLEIIYFLEACYVSNGIDGLQKDEKKREFSKDAQITVAVKLHSPSCSAPAHHNATAAA